jgi:molybdopterin-containing oxidoreductase family iron-sulfur binding subunit
VEFTAAYQAGRRLDGPKPQSSYHVQVESLLSLTGTKADHRVCVAPDELAQVMNQLALRLARKKGIPLPGADATPALTMDPFLDHLADELWQHQQRSLILCGSQDVALQVLANFLNDLLGNYGTTVDATQPYQRQDNDRELELLLQEIHDGKIAALFIHQSNPVHELPAGELLAEDLKQRVPLVVSLAPRLDETAQVAHFVCPDHHYLESWSDAEPVHGLVSLVQPAINPLGRTRSVMESLAAWTGTPQPAMELVRDHWQKELLPRSDQPQVFISFWDTTLQRGFAALKPLARRLGTLRAGSVRLASVASPSQPNAYTLVLYSKVGMPDSSQAYNPWLQELPDPISKVTWDNYACLSPTSAAGLSVADGDVVRLETSGEGALSLELPVLVQPGLHDHAVAVALGYGSVLSKRFANIGPAWLEAHPSVGPDGLVGKNAAAWLTWSGGRLCRTRDGVRLTKTGANQALASTQGYNQLSVPPHLAVQGQERRPIIQEMTLAEHVQPQHAVAASHEDLWPDDHPTGEAHWGMTIDLSACTGCSACVIACQAENNIPVVGRDEVRRHREMHWLRIDRYYTERPDGIDVAHQPMLCQHCGHAPCEVVCPVLATVHSDEGLNQQVYNRCVGTRYCANNCPYKVRRFNWFDYAHDDLLQNLVLNPDVTVRSRGVMEKCTFCVQRIEDARVAAGGRGQLPPDGKLQTACQQSCPAQAIVFGNRKNPTSRVAQLAAGTRSYQVLGELNIQPSVSYLGLVRNRPLTLLSPPMEGGEGRVRGADGRGPQHG